MRDEMINSETINLKDGRLRKLVSLSRKEALPQFFASTIALSMWLHVGIGGAFSAVLLPQLNRNNSDIQINENQMSWIASLLPLTTAPGSIAAAYLVDIVGRRDAAILQIIPFLASWTCLLFARNVQTIYVSRILIGFANGMASISTMYVTEIAHPDYRGTLSNISLLWASIGTLVAYVLGAYLHWRTASIVCLLLPLISLSLLCILPESPLWLLSVGKRKTAEKSVQWLYRNNDQADNQWKILTSDNINNENDNIKPLSTLTRISELFQPSVLKPFAVLFGFFIFQQLSGIYCLLFYTVDIFQRTNITMDPFDATILVGLIRMLSSLVTVIVSRRIGRRPLSLISGFGMTVTMFIAGGYQYYIMKHPEQISSSAITILTLLGYTFFSTIGFLCLPWSMSAELLPLHARGIGSGICNTVNHIFMFLVLKFFPFMADTLKPHGFLWFFSIASLLGTIFVYCLLPETLGKTLTEIEAHFTHKKNSKDITNPERF